MSNTKTFSLLVVLTMLALLASSVAQAEIEVNGPYSYTITKGAGDVRPCIEAAWNTWCGWIALTRTAPQRKFHEVVFEFYTEDYFSDTSGGHFAVGVRADGVTDANGDGSVDLRGSGIVIGAVTGVATNPPCGPTSFYATTAIEEFWAGGNCVFGADTEGPALDNGKRYRMRISSRFVNLGKL